MAQGELMREVETQSRETRKLWPQNKTDFRLKAESSFIAWQCKGLLGGSWSSGLYHGCTPSFHIPSNRRAEPFLLRASHNSLTLLPEAPSV